MAFDTTAWLNDLGFTKDEAAELLPKFAARTEKLESNQLRQSEFSKLMNSEQAKIAKAQDTLAAAETKLNADMAEWAELTAAEKAESGDLKKKLDVAEAKVFSAHQKLVRLAEEAGIDPKTVIDGEPPVKPEKKEATVDLEPLRAQMGGIADYMLTLNADLPYIAQEHLELTGERLDTRAFIAQIKMDLASGKMKAADLDPVARWEKQYGITEKRTVKAKAAHDREIAKAREEGRLAAMSESALPGAHPVGTHSPVFKTSNVAAGSKLQRPQPSQRMAGAIAAFATGKYRQGGDRKTT